MGSTEEEGTQGARPGKQGAGKEADSLLLHLVTEPMDKGHPWVAAAAEWTLLSPPMVQLGTQGYLLRNPGLIHLGTGILTQWARGL